MNRFYRVFSLARVAFVDGLRRYALVGLLLFALAAQIGGLLFFDFIPRDIGRASNDFLFSVSWFSGLIFLLFHAVNVLAWDDGRRVIHAFLARPISRYEYVFGMFLGLGLLLFILNFILGALGWGVLLMVKQSVSESYFQYLQGGCYLLACCGLMLIELILLAIIVLFSAVMRGHFPVLLLSLAYLFICSGLPVVRAALTNGDLIGGRSLTLLLTSLSALFPDFSRLDFKVLVTTETSPVFWDVVVAFSLGMAYLAVALTFAAWFYQRRDLQ